VCAINNQQAGPFNPADLQAQTQQGRIAKETLIWREGMANWTAAGQVPEVDGLFGTVPPPIPPPLPLR